ncbi:MAG: hypothetical protein AAGM27_06660 [Cyanobacteria bacterium J06554_3]
MIGSDVDGAVRPCARMDHQQHRQLVIFSTLSMIIVCGGFGAGGAERAGKEGIAVVNADAGAGGVAALDFGGFDWDLKLGIEGRGWAGLSAGSELYFLGGAMDGVALMLLRDRYFRRREADSGQTDETSGRNQAKDRAFHVIT